MSLGQLPDKSMSSWAVPNAAPLHRFSVDEYHRLGELGVLPPDVRTELLDGCIIDMNPIGIPHRYVVQETFSFLSRIVPSSWTVFMQQPITLSTSEPQPDLTVVRGRNADYKERHPSADDVGLLVEVADSSLYLDRRQKLPIYAAAGIPQYWIINLVDRQVECYSSPRLQQGASEASYTPTDVIAASGSLTIVLDGHPCGSIKVADLLP
jgi:Uma2 family endonuclease